MHSFYTIKYQDQKISMINQLMLPHEEVYETYSTYEEVADSIKNMVIRGAPAIGIAAAYGVALSFINKTDSALSAEYFNKVKKTFASTRPTAVNLFWALDKMEKVFKKVSGSSDNVISEKLLEKAHKIYEDDVAVCRAIGENGEKLLKDGARVLTHCNAGALATGSWGTALGIIRSAAKKKNIKVYACETRPYLQGARLTVWELMKDNIDVTLITDNMASHFISRGEIDAVIVGADRVASNGDAANKIGTLGHAISANYYKVPMYFAVPCSTIDKNTFGGKDIPIEERSSKEVTSIGNYNISPNGAKVLNPAFDVTPNELITAIITEKEVHYRPYKF